MGDVYDLCPMTYKNLTCKLYIPSTTDNIIITQQQENMHLVTVS